jgi:hypothetical protein
MPADAPAGASLVHACSDVPRVAAVRGALDLHLVFDAANTTTNLGLTAMDPAPGCGSAVEWRTTTPDGLRDGIDACGLRDSPAEAMVSANWQVQPGTYGLIANSVHGCLTGTSSVVVSSVVRIGLDVTDGLGTGGPNGSLFDNGDNLGSYLPGEIPAGPVIRWDERGNRLIPQRLSLRVETEGDVSYTNAVFRISAPTDHPGWCTNTREPGGKDSDQAVANWDPHDFSLSEAGYLAQTNALIVDGVAAVDFFCRDYGGSCRVRVVLEGTNDMWLARSFAIPADSDNDNLADRWEADAALGWSTVFGTNAVAAATSLFGASGVDEPADPDGPGPLAAHKAGGDGLTSFEEYRGFSLPGIGSEEGRPHVRLSPLRKEMVLQADAVATNGMPVLGLDGLSTVMQSLASVFERDLRIRLLWYHGGTPERGSYAGKLADDVVDDYNASFAASVPSPHARTGVRRMVFTTDLPRGRKLPVILGMTDGTAGVVDVAKLRRRFEGWDPMSCFLARHGVSPVDAIASVAMHEAGHMAGCVGDRRIDEEAPSFGLRARFDDEGLCKLSLADEGGRRYLVLRIPDGNQERFEVLGPQPVTVAALVSAINASDFFRASATTTGAPADAARIAFLPMDSGSRTFPADDDVWTANRLEAVLNGVMTYNDFVPAIHTAPAFDNVAGAAAAGPSHDLFQIEVGSVAVSRPLPP